MKKYVFVFLVLKLFCEMGGLDLELVNLIVDRILDDRIHVCLFILNIKLELRFISSIGHYVRRLHRVICFPSSRKLTV